MTNNVFDQYFRDQFYYEPACCRHVQILHVYLLYRPEDESNFNICIASSNQSISFSIFHDRPYKRTVFLVQKLAWPAFEPGSLSRKTCQFFAIHTCNKNLSKQICQGKIASRLCGPLHIVTCASIACYTFSLTQCKIQCPIRGGSQRNIKNTLCEKFQKLIIGSLILL